MSDCEDDGDDNNKSQLFKSLLMRGRLEDVKTPFLSTRESRQSVLRHRYVISGRAK